MLDSSSSVRHLIHRRQVIPPSKLLSPKEEDPQPLQFGVIDRLSWRCCCGPCYSDKAYNFASGGQSLREASDGPDGNVKGSASERLPNSTAVHLIYKSSHTLGRSKDGAGTRGSNRWLVENSREVDDEGNMQRPRKEVSPLGAS